MSHEVNKLIVIVYLAVSFIVGDVSDGTTHTVRDHPDLSFLPVLPYPVGYIEQKALQIKTHDC